MIDYDYRERRSGPMQLAQERAEPRWNEAPFAHTNLVPFSITKAQIVALPQWSYPDPVFVVRSSKQIESAIHRLLGEVRPANVGPAQPVLLGLDIEWKPMFSPADPYNPTSLLQLYAPGVAVIFRINDLRAEAGEEFVFPTLLKDLLTNPYIYKAGLAVKEDAQRLYDDFGIQTAGCLEIKELPIYQLCRPKSMVALSAMFLGISISKAQATSNWENPRLTHQQIRYAATDAYLSRELYVAMRAASEAYAATGVQLWRRGPPS